MMKRPYLPWIVPLVAALLLLSGCSGSDVHTPVARRGVIDLSDNGEPLLASSVRLDGEWAFYWNRLLTPADFHGPHPPAVSGYLRLPGAWNGARVDGRTLGGKGYATFRLRIVNGAQSGDLSLYLGSVASAYRLWVNGALAAQSGIIGKSATTEIPEQSVRLVRMPAGRSLELVLQVSNYHYRNGGVLAPVELGSQKRLESEQLRKWGVALFCIGAMVVMGLYHLALYFFRRRNVATLFFGIYCLLWAGYLFTSDSGDWAINLLIQQIPVPLLNRIDLLCFVVSLPVGYCFFRSLYPGEFSALLGRAAWLMAGLFTLLGLGLSTLAFTSIIPVYYLYAAVMILYSLVGLFLAVRRNREGARFILIGFLVLGGAGVNDMLCDMQVIRSVNLVQIGLFVFILFQAFALALRFSRAFSSVERLSSELASKNLALTEEMTERSRLAREIVNVSEEERRRISHELHDGLCQQLTGAKLHFSVLRRKLADVVEQLPEWRQLSTLLEEMVDQAYILSRGLWPVEHDPRGISPSLTELTRRLGETSGIAVELRESRGCTLCGNAGVNQLYRIAQEAITNAVRHADADRIVVVFDCAGRKTIALSISDNGIGRERAPRGEGGLGMQIMAHRARILGGRLTVADVPEGGTVVSCVVRCEEME